MLDQRIQRCSNIEPALEKCTIFERMSSCRANTKRLYNIYTTSAQRLRRWSNIVLGHTNVLCLLGVSTSVGQPVLRYPQ